MSEVGKPCSQLVVDISISADEYLKLYEGVAKDVVTQATDGRVVRFPARILQPFVTRSGVSGRFAIHFNQQNRFMGIERV